MNRKNFLQKAGTFGLGIGVLSLIRPTNVEGGVQDNSTLNEIVGKSDISNVANTVTEAIGNEELLTNAKTLSGAINENTQSLTNKVSDIYVGEDGKLHKVQGGADTVLPFNSYDDGRTKGRNDVIGSPNSYGLYTKAQYDANKVTYKSGNYNTGLNGETWRSTSFNTGFSTIIALQINCWNDEGNGYFNAFKNVRISGGKVSLDFYAADYVDNYVQWLAVGK